MLFFVDILLEKKKCIKFTISAVFVRKVLSILLHFHRQFILILSGFGFGVFRYFQITLFFAFIFFAPLYKFIVIIAENANVEHEKKIFPIYRKSSHSPYDYEK